MSLTLSQAQTLLQGIVGNSGTTRYLGLSSTPPQPIPSSNSGGGEVVSFSNYNITEPAASTSYARVRISSTEFANAAEGEWISGIYTTTIKNSKEIHFSEAVEDWGYFKYFFITDTAGNASSAKGSVVYIGELVYDRFVADTTYSDAEAQAAGFDGTPTTAENYAARKGRLYVKVGDIYQPVGDAEFDSAATYYVVGRGVFIEKNTVPLVRKDLLRISVQ